MKLPWSDTTSTENRKLSDDEYEQLREKVYEHSRINLGSNKRELVQARVSKRLRTLSLASYKAYIDLLDSRQGLEEMTNFIDAISTNHTFFFREPAHFDFMNQTALPELCPGKRTPGHPFRIWSAACSSGEEAYTISIVLSEYFGDGSNEPWTIDCTDISTRILNKAQRGIFPAERLSKMDKNTMRRYFQKGQGDWSGYYRVKKHIRERLRFHHLNLLKAPYPFDQPFDLIFCRNVMIYFDRPTQQELINHMLPLLRPGGYLMIGHAESLTGINHPFKTIRPAIYKKM